MQWGFDVQYHDNSARAETAMFGAGSPVADDGKTAQVPDYVANGEKWFNDGIWKTHFIPNANQVASALLNAGGEFASGNLAMNAGHTWFTCCVAPTAPAKQFKFGFAALPSYKGVTTAPLHVDTFSMLKTTKVPDAAFKALTAMVASPELLTIYGAMPADPTKQDAWFKSIDKNFPGITLDWSIVAGSAQVPGHPQQPVLRAELRGGQDRVPGLPEQDPDHVRARHGQGTGRLEDDPPGHLRQAGQLGQRSLLLTPSGVSRPRGSIVQQWSRRPR